jgi:hypothetical protein
VPTPDFVLRLREKIGHALPPSVSAESRAKLARALPFDGTTWYQSPGGEDEAAPGL